MNFDLRFPVGLMFTTFGLILILAGVGLFGAPDLKPSLGINMNLDWGIFMLAFGLVMLTLAIRGKKS